MKKILFYCILVMFLSCSPAIRITDYKPNKKTSHFKEIDSVFIPKPQIVKTAYKGFEYPYIHKNGFKNYEIGLSKHIKTKDSTYINELKFFNTYSSYYTRKSMYEKFNHWDKNIFIKGIRKPYLVWEKVKLFPNREKYYYVIAGGFECTKCTSNTDRIYASVMVLDENKNDCFSDKNPALKKELIKFFSEGIKNLTNSQKFYAEFHEK